MGPALFAVITALFLAEARPAMAQINFITSLGGYGSGNGQFNDPTGIALDADNDVWVVDSGNNRIEEFNPQGVFMRSVGQSGYGNGYLSYPNGIAVDASGDVWVVDDGNRRVEEFSGTGNFLSTFNTVGSGQPTGIAIGGGNTLAQIIHGVSDSARN